MGVDNLSAVLHGKGDLRLEQTPIEEPQDDDVQLRIGSVGICGTDLHYFLDGRTGRFIVHSPIVLGHETSGTVSKVGRAVTHLKVGDRVAVEPNLTCHTCEFCKRGSYNLCPRVDLTEVTPYRGHLRRYAIMKADLVFKVPDSLSMDEAALVEPFAVAVHACRKGRVAPGQKVLVCGAGPIGLLCMTAARAYGVDSIVQTDIVDAKLKVATAMGVNYTMNTRGMSPEAIAEKVQEILGGPPEITFECTGQETCLQTAVYATKPGGTILVVGMGPQLSKVPIMEAVVKEIVIQGIFCYANCYPTAISLLGSGRIDLKPMITHRYPLEKVKDAFDHAISGRDGAVKIVLNC
ncbi:sorbitol dehydrogenase [Galendromus occidentalis]|uniref:Sorbitol dehydrogenase n=1 Tax=Galendromus occidentalis TaxID=34638 RepID=A0AAJ6W0B7_9ACAR|nr:sorbitol dehydrogenase [Galendromus occidentalis]